MAWEHAPDMVAALVSITLLVYPRFYPLRPTCFPRYLLHLGYNLLSEMVLELMPCAARSRLWCGFDADSSRLPSPFSSFLSSVVLLLMSLWVSVVIFASYFSCFFLFRCLLCDLSQTHRHCAQHIITPSVITLRPFTPCLNSWCLLRGLLLHPAALVVLQVLTPDGFLWKVRDSNPRPIFLYRWCSCCLP